MEIPVSIIIPAFNPGRYLEEALDSVIRQSFQPRQIIVIDDGSEPAVTLSPRHQHCVTLIRQNNAGQAIARNRGMSQASGEWIAFLDADDLWHPRKLELQWQAVAGHPEITIVGCKAVLIDQSGRIIGAGPSLSPETHLLSRTDFVKAAPYAALVPSMAMVRKTACDQTQGFEPRFQPIEDLVFFDGLLSGGATCLVLGESLLKRRIHGSSLTLRYREMIAAFLRWEEHLVRPSLGEDIGRQVRATAYFIAGLSGLAKGAGAASRVLLKKALANGFSHRILPPFLLSFLDPALVEALRNTKRRLSASQAEAAWQA